MPDDSGHLIDGIDFRAKRRASKPRPPDAHLETTAVAPADSLPVDEEAALVAAFSAPGDLEWSARKWFAEETAKVMVCRKLPAMGLVYINERGEPDMVWMSVGPLASRAFADGLEEMAARVRETVEEESAEHECS